MAIAAGTVIGAWAFAGRDASTTIMLGTAAGGLILGLIDDKFTLSPTAKLVGTLVLGAGFVGTFALKAKLDALRGLRSVLKRRRLVQYTRRAGVWPCDELSAAAS